MYHVNRCTHPDPRPVLHLRVLELRPPCVVVEVPHDHGDVGVAGLADGLAVVEALEDGDEPGKSVL